MSNYQVYVVSQAGVALMPTRRFGKVRRLLKSGKARVIQRKPFTIQLLYATTEYRQPLILGIDPGANHIACAVRNEKGEVVYAGDLETRNRDVSDNMEKRRMHRRSRRRHSRKKIQRRAKVAKTAFVEKSYQISKTEQQLVCKFIKPRAIRFHNRRQKDWLTPTAGHLLESHKNFVTSLKKILPISKMCLEYGQFDIHKLKNPEIEGKEYQNGAKKGCANSQQYVLCRDQHTCQLCRKSQEELQVHHVIWKSQLGGDSPENLLTLCTKCHTKVHQNPKIDAKVKQMFAGMRKRYVHTTLVNSIMPFFMKWLVAEFGEVSITYGYQTKEKRRTLNLEKQHHIDAYLISLDNQQARKVQFNDVIVYRFKQFRRHHRQIIHATRDRNYKQDKKVVAKNRRKRTGQLTDSLADLIEKSGKQVLSCLRVLPGKKVKRSNFNKFRKGDVVCYKGKHYVVKGYGQMGCVVGFVDHNQYVCAQDCQLVIRNTGIVCL